MERLPNFPDLSETELQTLIARSTLLTYPKNTVVIQEGEEGGHVYFLLSGGVKVYLADQRGHEVVINQMAPGDYFGEMSLEPGAVSAPFLL
jgi:CRP/FNR family cyclic AMP-dependent transcriptional regulator